MAEADQHLTCREFVNGLAEYLDGSQPRPIRRDFAVHSVGCPNCERYAGTYALAIALGRLACDLPADPADPPDSLVDAILRSARIERRPT